MIKLQISIDGYEDTANAIKAIEAYSGEDFLYAETFEAEYLPKYSTIQFRLESIPLQMEKFKKGEYEDDSISFMMDKNMCKTLAEFLLNIFNSYT